LGLPVVAIVDSNSDPTVITYPVPGNDDASRAIELYCELVSQAVLDGLQAEQTADGVKSEKAEPVAEPAPVAASA
jgi:small subunit ribosomal protein S2